MTSTDHNDDDVFVFYCSKLVESSKDLVRHPLVESLYIIINQN